MTVEVLAAAVEAVAVAAAKDRTLGAFTEDQVECSGGPWLEWDDGKFGAFAQDLERSVPSLEPGPRARM